MLWLSCSGCTKYRDSTIQDLSKSIHTQRSVGRGLKTAGGFTYLTEGAWRCDNCTKAFLTFLAIMKFRCRATRQMRRERQNYDELSPDARSVAIWTRRGSFWRSDLKLRRHVLIFAGLSHFCKDIGLDSGAFEQNLSQRRASGRPIMQGVPDNLEGTLVATPQGKRLLPPGVRGLYPGG